MLGGPCFRDQSRARGPFATHAQTEDDATDSKLDDGLRKAARSGGGGIDKDGGRKRTRAADAVRDKTEDHSAKRGSEQRERAEQATRGFADAEVLHQIREDHRIKHHIERVQHPAEASRSQGGAFGGRHFARPFQPENSSRGPCFGYKIGGQAALS